jgi:putative membrane protein
VIPVGHATSAASWSPDPLVVLSVGALGWAYALGWTRLRATARGSRLVPPWRAATFVVGLVTVVVALMSPVEALSSDFLSAHMGQHLLLVTVAAPLIVLGMPALPVALAMPNAWRRKAHRLGAAPPARVARRILTQPLTVWTLHVVALWAWHVPALYEAGVRSDVAHAVEHASFLGTAVLFWWVLMERSASCRRLLAPGTDVLYVVTAGIQGAALGALLTFASAPLYQVYVERASLHGVSALNDQQLAGLIMWIPAGVVYLAAAALLFVRWLRSVEEQTERQEGAAVAVRLQSQDSAMTSTG